MNIENYSAASGRIINERGQTVNIVDLLGGGKPVNEEKHNIESYALHSGRVIGEDGKVYNIVDLFGNVEQKTKIITSTDTTATIEPNTSHEYGEVAGLNLTLSDETGSYEVVFESGTTPTVLSITSEKQLLWHNEPVVLANKVYVLAIEVGTTYARAVLSYAE